MGDESGMFHDLSPEDHDGKAAEAERVDGVGLSPVQEDTAVSQQTTGNESFWAEQAETLVSWSKRWTRTLAANQDMSRVRWFVGGRLNVAYNCLDRHLDDGRKNKAALIWQGEQEADVRVYTYQMLHREVCRFANVLKKLGLKKGDRIVCYLPMLPELVIAMLASARIGAVHSVVFAGFSAQSLRQRIIDCQACLVITADYASRGGQILPLKEIADEALAGCDQVTGCVVVQRGTGDVAMQDGRDTWYHREVNGSDIGLVCEPEEMTAEDPLFILYTSGSTGPPKGVVHSCGGYLVYALYSLQRTFSIKDDDTFWCTADIGWITGHTCTVYGPLGLGATSLMFEGIPSWPGPDRFWQIVEKYRVSVFYTAPTVIRVLMRYGTEPAEIHDLSSLRCLGSVGEPLNSDAREWYARVIGNGRLQVTDTWWQTETSGIMIASTVAEAVRGENPGGLPLPGVEMTVLDDQGQEVAAGGSGSLVVARPWPGMLTGLAGAAGEFFDTYYKKYPGKFSTGDCACRDGDGRFTVTGRFDDVIDVAGRRLGTGEIESAITTHPSVAEAAVVAMSHPIKGQVVYAYISVKDEVMAGPQLLAEIKDHVHRQIGSFAVPETIQYTRGLPKTRSGKIMRRVLRKIASAEYDDFGDTSTMADPSVIADLIAGKTGEN
ncbi:MAG: acetate--CoA ligase [Desulfopila sp.]